jgi:hypothetical protein
VEIPLGTVIAVGTTIFVAGGAWYTVRSSTLRLESQRDKDTAAQTKANEVIEGRVNERLREYNEKKDDQARRIGRCEQRVSVLEGRLHGDDPPRRRVLTAGGGVAIESEED